MQVIAITVLAALPTIAISHHSGAQYDRSTIVEKEATVIRFDFRNPHAYLIVSDSSGAEWEVEMISAVRLRRAGWDAESFARGDQLTFRAIANRNPQSNRVRLRSITTADGDVFDLAQPENTSSAPGSFPEANSLEAVWGTDPESFGPISDVITNYPLTPKGRRRKSHSTTSWTPLPSAPHGRFPNWRSLATCIP